MGEADTPQNGSGGGGAPLHFHSKSATVDTPLICINFTGPQEFDPEGYSM